MKAALNLLVFSVAFGGGVVHLYVVLPLAFKHLPRAEFGRLQNKVFPTYFLGQTALPLVLALTAPVAWRAAAPFLAVSALAGALNYFWFLPVCQQIKRQRDAAQGAELERLTKRFGMYHGFSSLANLVLLAGLAGYGYIVAGRL